MAVKKPKKRIPQIITICNHKGGVGKSTVAIVLANYVALGKKVLLIDGDPQHNLTSQAMSPDEVSQYSGFLDFETDFQKPFFKISENFYLAPCNDQLVTLDIQSPRSFSGIRDQLLALDFDYIIIDSPPSLGNVFVAMLMACTHILFVADASTWAIQGINKTYEVLLNLIEVNLVSSDINIIGILINKYVGDALERRKFAEMQAEFKDTFPVLGTPLRRYVALADLQGFTPPWETQQGRMSQIGKRIEATFTPLLKKIL